jgi:hypothetical protein
MVVTRQTGNVTTPEPSDVTIGWLDLDYVGTQITEHPPGEGASQYPGKI